MIGKHELDRRVQKTRQMLNEALLVLIAERGYDHITVQDITEQANIGRATFYLHYRDKEELLAASLRRLFSELIHSVEIKEDFHSTRTLSLRVFQHVAQHRRLYHALLSEAGPPMITLRMRTDIADLIQRDIIMPLACMRPLAIEPALVAIHSAGSLIALVTWWLDHDLSPSAEQMGDLFWQLIHLGIDAAPGFSAFADGSQVPPFSSDGIP